MKPTLETLLKTKVGEQPPQQDYAAAIFVLNGLRFLIISPMKSVGLKLSSLLKIKPNSPDGK